MENEKYTYLICSEDGESGLRILTTRERAIIIAKIIDKLNDASEFSDIITQYLHLIAVDNLPTLDL